MHSRSTVLRIALLLARLLLLLLTTLLLATLLLLTALLLAALLLLLLLLILILILILVHHRPLTEMRPDGRLQKNASLLRFVPNGTSVAKAEELAEKRRDESGTTMGRYLLLWLLGVPIPILILIWLLGGLH